MVKQNLGKLDIIFRFAKTSKKIKEKLKGGKKWTIRQ